MRSNYPTTWNLKLLYKNDSDPQMVKDRETIEKKSHEFVKKWKHRTDYLTDPKLLRQALDDYEEWTRYYEGGGKEWYYFHLRSEQDQIDPTIRAKMNQIQNFKQRIDDGMRFFYLSLAKISEKNQAEILKSSQLRKYKHYLERIFAESKHLLSEPEERIMSMKSIPAYANWVKMTSAFLSKYEKPILDEDGREKTKSFADILSLIDSSIKKTRDSAAFALNEILAKNSDVATEELNAILEHKRTDDELRKIPRPDYSRHLSDDIDTEIVDTVVETVAKHNNIAKRFYWLKARLLGVKKLQYHERNVAYQKISKTYSYKDTVNLLTQVFSNLDSDFSAVLERFVNEGQIDVHPQKGKRSGAFCAYHLISQPIYILLNFSNKLEDVLTFAHEMGHGINDELVKQKQHSLHFGTPVATAEVASTFMEDFVLEEILNDADDELRLGIMIMKLNSDISSIFRQVACYQLEQQLHNEYRKKGYLSKEDIGKMFQKYMQGYMGNFVEQSQGSENWWVYWAHIRYFFYVYSYASGLLISKTLQHMIKKDKTAIVTVKEFLSAGLSESPENIFRKLGINIRDKKFWEDGLKEVEQLLEDTTKLAKKLGKI